MNRFALRLFRVREAIGIAVRCARRRRDDGLDPVPFHIWFNATWDLVLALWDNDDELLAGEAREP